MGRPRAFLSLSTILTVVSAGLPRVALDELLKRILKVSVDSFVASFVRSTLKLFDDSPDAKVSVPKVVV